MTSVNKLVDMQDVLVGYEAASQVQGDAYAAHKASIERGMTAEEFASEWKDAEKAYVDSKFAGYMHYILKDNGEVKWNGFTLPVHEAESAGFSYTIRDKGKPSEKAFVHVLPGAYKTSKSVLMRALDAEIEHDELLAMGKTAIEKELDRLKEKSSVFDTAMKQAKALHKKRDQLSSLEWDMVVNAVIGGE